MSGGAEVRSSTCDRLENASLSLVQASEAALKRAADLRSTLFGILDPPGTVGKDPEEPARGFLHAVDKSLRTALRNVETIIHHLEACHDELPRKEPRAVGR